MATTVLRLIRSRLATSSIENATAPLSNTVVAVSAAGCVGMSRSSGIVVNLHIVVIDDGAPGHSQMTYQVARQIARELLPAHPIEGSHLPADYHLATVYASW
jgi:hypothetical protein